MNTVQNSLTNYDAGADVVFGTPPLVIRNTTSPFAIRTKPLTNLTPPVVIPAPTEIIPYKAPDLPQANTLITGLKPSTVAIPSTSMKDAQPVYDPLVTDKTYIPPVLNKTGSLTGYRDQILSSMRTPAPAPALSIWVWIILAIVIVAAIYYYSKKS